MLICQSVVLHNISLHVFLFILFEKDLKYKEQKRKRQHDRLFQAPDTGKEYKIVNGKEYFLQNVAIEDIYVAEKSSCLIYREAVPGQELVVRKSDGTVEAVEIEKEGCLIVQNATLDGKPVLNTDGSVNEYQMEKATFEKKYVEVDSEAGFAKPKGGIQYFYKVPEDIAVMVPWGENGSPIPLKVDAGSYLNVTNLDDVYGIDAPIFDKTYAKPSLSDLCDQASNMHNSLNGLENGSDEYIAQALKMFATDRAVDLAVGVDGPATSQQVELINELAKLDVDDKGQVVSHDEERELDK